MHLFELKQYKQIVDMPQAIIALKKCSDVLQFGDEPIVRGMSGEADFYVKDEEVWFQDKCILVAVSNINRAVEQFKL